MRLYYRGQGAVQGSRGQTIGGGVYALNDAALARTLPLPDGLVADDLYVHQSFADDERVQVGGAVGTVRPPRTMADLMRVRRRSFRGNAAYYAAHPGRSGSRAVRTPAALRGHAVAAGWYLAVNTAAKARNRLTTSGAQEWDRDTSRR